MNQHRVFIFDTTLHYGEGSPGTWMTRQEGLRIARAMVPLSIEGVESEAHAQGFGPADATCKAVEQITCAKLPLRSVYLITQGANSQNEEKAKLERLGGIVNDNGADADIVDASVNTCINVQYFIREEPCRDHLQGGAI